ncbi:hypothetical protein LIZ31_16915, partial [Eggerthella lenta]|nr:hypothetical protein [Eggerthella lenta]
IGTFPNNLCSNNTHANNPPAVNAGAFLCFRHSSVGSSLYMHSLPALCQYKIMFAIMLFTCIVAVIHMPDMPDLKLSKQLDDIIKGDIKMG